VSRPTLNPFVKLNRRFSRHRLAALSTTRALNVLVFFWCEQEADGTIMASYRQIMQGIGTRSHGAIAAALTRLETCGLIARLGEDDETGVARYVLLEDWTRYMRKGVPQGPAGAPEGGAPPAPTPESGAPPSPEGGALLENLVVVDPDQDSQQQLLSNSAPEGGASPAPKNGVGPSTQDYPPDPLRVAVEEGFLAGGAPTPLAGQIVAEMVATYGEQAVLDGMAICVKQGVRTLAYLGGVLRNRKPLLDYDARAEDDFPNPPPTAPPTEDELRWQTVYDDLRMQLPGETFAEWLRDARFVDCVDGVFTIGVGHRQAVDWLEDRLKGVIVRALRRVAGEAAEVRFVVDERACVDSVYW
jgi:hypothetical protein